MGRRGKKSTKVKIDKYDLIPRDHDRGLYERLDRLVSTFHKDLGEARIALAWMHAVVPDKDGGLKLGQCRIAPALDRQMHGYDIVITLNYEAWQQTQNETWRDALLDHELCHALQLQNKGGEQKTDAKGHGLYRGRKHDVEDFTEIVRRYGAWKSDLEAFLRAGAAKLKAPEPTLFDRAPGAAPPSDAPERRAEPNPADSYRGFAHVYTAKDGKALTVEGAREKVDRYYTANNDGAKRATEISLREAGWVRPSAELERRAAEKTPGLGTLTGIANAAEKSGATVTIQTADGASATITPDTAGQLRAAAADRRAPESDRRTASTGT